MTADTVGFLAFCLTIVYTGIGLPIQIRQNFRRRSVQGLSLFMNAILLLVMVSWVVYGWIVNNWYIMGSNIPGAVCVGVILAQFYFYRGRRPA